MEFINEYTHTATLKRELRRLLPTRAFAAHLWQALGYELHYRLVEWKPQSEVEYSSRFPVEALFAWIANNGGLDPEWLASEDGSYLDDNGVLIPSTIHPTYSGVEQLASYGLWALEENIECLGSEPDVDGIGENGFTKSEVIEHRAACLLTAYQSLVYAQRLKLEGANLDLDELKASKHIDWSSLGRAGAAKRHRPMKMLQTWAIEKYRAGKWKSANQAAYELQNEVMAHSRTIGANMAETNAQRTPAEWFRKSV